MQEGAGFQNHATCLAPRGRKHAISRGLLGQVKLPPDVCSMVGANHYLGSMIVLRLLRVLPFAVVWRTTLDEHESMHATRMTMTMTIGMMPPTSTSS